MPKVQEASHSETPVSRTKGQVIKNKARPSTASGQPKDKANVFLRFSTLLINAELLLRLISQLGKKSNLYLELPPTPRPLLKAPEFISLAKKKKKTTRKTGFLPR